MVHDIWPKTLDNKYYENSVPDDDSYVIFTDGKHIFMKETEDGITFPQYVDYSVDKYVYLFSVDGRRFFLGSGDTGDLKQYTVKDMRSEKPLWISFAAAVAIHIYNWYKDNRFCGRCGKETVHKKDERAVICSCGNIVYPRINPVVIAAVIHDGKILATRYSEGHSAYRNYALVAGFVEIGETLEEAVKREVYEETGLRVENITYRQSQPWPYSQSLIAGFFCEVSGDCEIRLDEDELKEAVWLSPEEIPDLRQNRSLTAEMFWEFKNRAKKQGCV